MIPAHNAESTIANAIESILNQDFQDFELWILENGSTDKTLEIAHSYENYRVKVFELGKVGFQGALEWGIREAKTPYVARMDADDICLTNRFSEQIKILENNPSYVLCGSDVFILTPFNHVIEVNKKNRRSNAVGFNHMSDIPGQEKRFFADPSVVFRRKAAIDVGLYDSDYAVGDVSLWIRMLRSHIGYQIKTPTLIYRWVPESMSNTLKFNQQTLACRIKYYGNVYPHSGDLLKLPQEEKRENGPVSFWIRVAIVELLAGYKEAYFKALKLAGLKIGLQHKVKAWMLPLYRAYHKWRYETVHVSRFDIQSQYVTK